MHHSQERKFLAVGSAKSCEAGADVSTTWRFYVSWHWCTNCTDWPTSDYDSEWHSGKERPKSGELDNQCKSKEAASNCS